jgi:hypothetical protein
MSGGNNMQKKSKVVFVLFSLAAVLIVGKVTFAAESNNNHEQMMNSNSMSSMMDMMGDKNMTKMMDAMNFFVRSNERERWPVSVGVSVLVIFITIFGVEEQIKPRCLLKLFWQVQKNSLLQTIPLTRRSGPWCCAQFLIP